MPLNRPAHGCNQGYGQCSGRLPRQAHFAKLVPVDPSEAQLLIASVAFTTFHRKKIVGFDIEVRVRFHLVERVACRILRSLFSAKVPVPLILPRLCAAPGTSAKFLFTRSQF